MIARPMLYLTTTDTTLYHIWICRLQTPSFWKSLKFLILERVKAVYPISLWHDKFLHQSISKAPQHIKTISLKQKQILRAENILGKEEKDYSELAIAS